MRTERAESRVCNKYALRQHCVDSAIYTVLCALLYAAVHYTTTVTYWTYLYLDGLLSENSSTFLKRFNFSPEEILKTRVGFANQSLAVWVVRRMGTSVIIWILLTPLIVLLQHTLHWISRLVAVPWSLLLVWSWLVFICLGQLNWEYIQ